MKSVCTYSVIRFLRTTSSASRTALRGIHCSRHAWLARLGGGLITRHQLKWYGRTNLVRNKKITACAYDLSFFLRVGDESIRFGNPICAIQAIIFFSLVLFASSDRHVYCLSVRLTFAHILPATPEGIVSGMSNPNGVLLLLRTLPWGSVFEWRGLCTPCYVCFWDLQYLHCRCR